MAAQLVEQHHLLLSLLDLRIDIICIVLQDRKIIGDLLLLNVVVELLAKMLDLLLKLLVVVLELLDSSL